MKCSVCDSDGAWKRRSKYTEIKDKILCKTCEKRIAYSCRCKYKKDYKEKNAARSRKYMAKQIETNYEEFKIRRKASAKKCYVSNPELFKKHRNNYRARLDQSEELREIDRQYKLRWKEKNPHISANRRAAKRNATVSWADVEEIKHFYFMAREMSKISKFNYHVDHIVPLTHPLVCGLHNEFNLRVITAQANLSKNNTFIID